MFQQYHWQEQSKDLALLRRDLDSLRAAKSKKMEVLVIQRHIHPIWPHNKTIQLPGAAEHQAAHTASAQSHPGCKEQGQFFFCKLNGKNMEKNGTQILFDTLW